MKQNRLDRITDGVLERVGRIKGEVRLQYKNTNPYRMPQKSPDELLQRYIMLSDEDKQMYRQQFGESFNDYEKQMNNLITRRVNNAG